VDRFDKVLLYQSYVMLVVQMMLLHLCIKLRSSYQATSSALHPPREVSFHTFQRWMDYIRTRYFAQFWSWREWTLYAWTLVIWLALLEIATWVWKDTEWYGDAVGAFALALEGCLPIPQIITNYRNKSVKGLR
jgi:hypothetical protein